MNKFVLLGQFRWEVISTLFADGCVHLEWVAYKSLDWGRDLIEIDQYIKLEPLKEDHYWLVVSKEHKEQIKQIIIST